MAIGISAKCYLNGQKHGVSTTWYNDGNLKSQGTYHNNNKVGLWKKWDENGNLIG